MFAKPQMRRGALIALLGCVSRASPVRAQTDDERAGARAAAEEGGNAFQEGRFSEAADLFARAESLVHSPVQLLYLARSLDKVGALVRAREAYSRIVNEVLPANAPEPWREAQRGAAAELEALTPRIPYVTATVEGPAAGSFQVLMDGTAILPALVGIPRPVDPGPHRFQVKVGDRLSEPTVLVAEPGKRERIVLEPPKDPAATDPLSEPAAPSGHEVAPASAGAAQGQSAPVADQGPSSGGPSPLVWAAFGVGVVGLGVGTAFAYSAKSSRGDLADAIDRYCRGPGSEPECPDSQKNKISGLESDGNRAATLATVGFVVGGLGVATGAVLLLLTGSQHESTARVTPYVGVGTAGMSGRF